MTCVDDHQELPVPQLFHLPSLWLWKRDVVVNLMAHGAGRTHSALAMYEIHLTGKKAWWQLEGWRQTDMDGSGLRTLSMYVSKTMEL